MSVGADSTIAPIFAGALALLATAGSPHYAADAAALALGVGLALALGGALGLGFVADLLSIPVTTGFLAGIAGHIVVSQAPALIGVAPPSGPLVAQVVALAGALGQTSLPTLGLGLFVLALMLVGERLSPRFPGALIGLALAAVVVVVFGLEGRGVATLGTIEGTTLRLGWPQVALARSAADRAARHHRRARRHGADRGDDAQLRFRSRGRPRCRPRLRRPRRRQPARRLSRRLSAQRQPAAHRDRRRDRRRFAARRACLRRPRARAGGVRRRPARPCAARGARRRAAVRRPAHLPRSGRWSTCGGAAAPSSPSSSPRMLALLVLPIQQGVAIGVILSLLHGVWTTTRARLVEFERIPGTSIWWPASALQHGERAPGVRVVGLQAPLSFLNAYAHPGGDPGVRQGGRAAAGDRSQRDASRSTTPARRCSPRLVSRLRAEGVDVAFARLEFVARAAELRPPGPGGAGRARPPLPQRRRGDNGAWPVDLRG